MEKVHIKEGRFIPAAGYTTEAERLRMVETFLVRFSEEMEYALQRLSVDVARLTEEASHEGEVAE